MSLEKKAPFDTIASTGANPKKAPADLVELGRVLGAHGIKGWIKVQPFSSDSEALGATKRWWLRSPTLPLTASEDSVVPAVAINLVWAKPHGASWIACVKGLGDRDQAQALKGKTVLVPRSAFPKLQDNEYYWVDLIGCSVITHIDGVSQHFGLVESVQDSPAHPILVVRQQDSVSGQCVDRLDEKGKPIYSLIPFVAAHIGEIDLQARTIETDWPRDF